MALSLITPALLAGAAAAAAIAFAPAAAAEEDELVSRPGAADRETSQQDEKWNGAPKGWTNEAQWAKPGSGSNPFGSLPKPPVFALD